MPAQHIFNLAQFNPEAANLHLMIQAAKKFHVAVGPVAGEVTGLVENWRILQFSNLYKLLRCQLRPVEVAPRQPGPADVQFARHANRHRLKMRIEQVELGVGDRPADGGRFVN